MEKNENEGDEDGDGDKDEVGLEILGLACPKQKQKDAQMGAERDGTEAEEIVAARLREQMG